MQINSPMLHVCKINLPVTEANNNGPRYPRNDGF